MKKQKGKSKPSLSTKKLRTILKNEFIIEKREGSFQEVRHIVLEGANHEIGKALGDIAQEWLEVELFPDHSPLYTKARKLYIKNNYPILYERMKGVAKSFGLSPQDNSLSTSTLYFDRCALGCSMIFFPASCTSNGHPLLAHNLDFYEATISEIAGKHAELGECQLFSRNFVIQLHPDKGYASIAFGSLDLLNGVCCGMNSEGLVVARHVDQEGPRDRNAFIRGYGYGGLMLFQLMRLLLDTCATVEEAKIAILNNKVTPGFLPCHLFIADRHSRSFVFENAAEDFSTHFTDNNGRPEVMTNHAVFKHPDPEKFPETDLKKPANTFYRYKVLADFVKARQGKFAPEDAQEAISKVFIHTKGSAGHDGETPTHPHYPTRTMFTELYDLADRSVEVKFFQKDGPDDPGTGLPSLIFSEPIKFKLKTTKNN